MADFCSSSPSSSSCLCQDSSAFHFRILQVKDKREMWSSDLQPCKGHYHSCHLKTHCLSESLSLWSFNLPSGSISKISDRSPNQEKLGPSVVMAWPRCRKTPPMPHITRSEQINGQLQRDNANGTQSTRGASIITARCWNLGCLLMPMIICALKNLYGVFRIYTAGALETHELLACRKTT